MARVRYILLKSLFLEFFLISFVQVTHFNLYVSFSMYLFKKNQQLPEFVVYLARFLMHLVRF